MFALKNVAFFGHMDGWEYQDRVMALCSFMCDALCSVFPKTSNQAWGWAVPFWRIFNWKVKISTRPRDKSCCHSSQPPPRPPLCVSLHVYICRSPSPSTFICYFFLETQGFWVPLRVFPNRTQLCQLDLPQAVGGGWFVVWELLALTCWWGCWLCTTAVYCQLPAICVSQLTTCR